MRCTFFGLLAALAIAAAACGDDGVERGDTNTSTSHAAVVVAISPPAAPAVAAAPAIAPPAETGQPASLMPGTVPQPNPPCTHCPNANTTIVTPSR